MKSIATRAGTVSACLLLLAGLPLSGFAAGTPTSTAITPAGDEVKAGDRLALKAEATIFTRVDDPTDSKKYCAPAGTVIRVDSVEAPKTSVGGTDAAGKPVSPSVTTDPKTGTTKTDLPGATQVTQKQTDNTLYVHVKKVGSKSTPVAKFIGIDPGYSPCANAPSGATPVVPQNEYTTSATELSHYGTYRDGWTWGALTIPYKYELTDHSFQAKPSVAAYVGWETWVAGANSASVLALGAGGSTQPTQTTPASGGVPASTTGGGTQALYTLAVGQIFSLGGTFKGGVLVGKDWAGSSTGFKYEGHTWIAVTLGAGF
jgi:hypothetical protein